MVMNEAPGVALSESFGGGGGEPWDEQPSRLFSDRKFSGLPGYLRAVERSPCGFNQRERLQALQRDLWDVRGSTVTFCPH